MTTHIVAPTCSHTRHLQCRGHSVFDTAKLIDGHLYQLDEHLNRLLLSAEKAGVEQPIALDQMYRTIMETAAASCIASGAETSIPRLKATVIVPLALVRSCFVYAELVTLTPLKFSVPSTFEVAISGAQML